MKDKERTGRRRGHGRYGFIPAGVLIGLGAGLLAGFPGSGVMIGLGLGFLASALVPVKTNGTEPEGTEPKRANIPMFLIGIFFILAGAGTAFAPADIWPYAVAGFLILLGAGFLARGLYRNA